MLLRDFIHKFFKHVPNWKFKNKLKCFFYNVFVKTDFKCFYRKDHFEYRFKEGFRLKSYEGIFGELAVTLKGYLQKDGLKKGDVVIDGGAYRGAFALYASKIVGDDGIVFAFEPDPENYKKVVRNIELNGLKNIVAIEKGLWNKDTVLKFDNQSSSLSTFLSHKKGNSLISVPVTSIDNEMKRRGIKKVDFIKMDIEGAEVKAIEGAKNLLKRNNVRLAIASYHIINGKKTCFDLEKLFSELGYTSFTSYPLHLTTYGNKKI